MVAEPGTGKTRLCFEFLESCRAADLPVYQGHAVSHGTSIPLLPILEIFRDYFGIGQMDDAPIAREKISRRLLLVDESLRDVLPVLFQFLGVPDGAEPAREMDAEARQLRLFGLLRKLLQRSPVERPAVTLIEDLHWLDAASAAWVAEWVDAVARTHNLLLVNFRPEYHAGWMQRSHYQQVALAPLGAEETRELIAGLLGSEASATGLPEIIHRRTGGNPFFAEEVVQGMVGSGHLEGERGGYRPALRDVSSRAAEGRARLIRSR
jgi:predicted ATPase